MKARRAVEVCVAVLLMGLCGVAQDSASSVLGRVDIQFKFMAGKKLMPAGKYEFVHQRITDDYLVLRGEKSSVQLRIVERLAETTAAEKQGARVVFNTVGDTKVLSEFWPSGNRDGYLLATSKESHGHEVVQEK